MNMSYTNMGGCGYSNALGVEGAPAMSKRADVTDTVNDPKNDFFDTVKGGATRVVTTVKETAKDVVDEVKEQQQNLDKKERLIKSIPNSFLVFGMVGLLAFSLLKK